MENQPVTIRVAPEVAQDYETASPAVRREADAVLSRKLRETLHRLRGPGEFSRETASSPRLTAQALLDSGLVGMWKDRPETEDSAAFARRLREESQRR